MAVIGFDVFGTLVDPTGIAAAVRPFAGEGTDALVAEWRRTQLEYAFRRAAMNRYLPFDRVTRAALDHALAVTAIEVPETEREDLVAGWTRLPAFADAAPALEALRAAGHHCVAFSNGTAAGLRTLLDSAGLTPRLDAILSVEAVQSYKPDPRVYDYLVQEGGLGHRDTWLVSGNAWDVLGARSAGLSAAWIRRDDASVFDPWEEQPDRVVGNLGELAEAAPFT